MKSELYDFDIYPKVFLTEVEQHITLHSLQARGRKFENGAKFRVVVREASRSPEWIYPGSESKIHEELCIADANGDIHFTLTCPREGMYMVFVCEGEETEAKLELRIYALAHDMAGRYPFRGDLHMHTCRSDGHETPATVCANYREAGYDFTVISDHGRYYPSLEARKIFHIGLDDESDLTNLLVVQGEEIHLPLNPAHYVNFGGKFSINALVTPSANAEPGDGVAFRSLNGECPETMTKEAYEAMIRERAKNVPLALESERLSYAAICWIYEQIQAGGGLGIFPHPYWLFPTMHVSEDYTRYIYEQKPFDAFEVLGGESYYQHNGFQTAFYYEMKQKGFDRPIVGSTDSHGSTENNPGGRIDSTIVFAPLNKTASLIDAIKNAYSVAVDTISKEYRLVGDFRWVKYGSFLLEEWYPLHDRACRAEGYYMGRFAEGDADAEPVLRAMKNHLPDMMHKYFNL